MNFHFTQYESLAKLRYEALLHEAEQDGLLKCLRSAPQACDFVPDTARRESGGFAFTRPRLAAQTR